MAKTKPYLSALFLFLIAFSTAAQGIRGTIKNIKGQSLPNASFFIPELKTGSSSNINGEFSLKLPEGSYTVIVRYIGYESEEFKADIGKAWIQKDFVLKEQAFVLEEVAVGRSKKEDLAYTIMRKTISKKKYNQLLYDGFTMKAYIKGSGQLTKAPAIFKRKLEKEGLSMDEAYATESVSEFKFRQPNKVEEKVISVKTRGNSPANIGPSSFLSDSFYNNKIGNMISPFSTSAFRFYEFKYEGCFTDKQNLVYKIRVIPRSNGDNVFSGSVYVIDDHWAIHSIDLNCTLMGFPLSIKQNFSEVAPRIFLPITHQMNFSMSMLGFKGQYKYLVSCSNYQVDLNKRLTANFQLLDEKVDDIPAELRDKHQDIAHGEQAIKEKTLTRKQLSKVIDDFEKASFKEDKQAKVITQSNFSIEKFAAKRDSAYWDSIRPIPLTASELKGYRKMDSLITVDHKTTTDSINKAKRGFKFSDILGGHVYRLSKTESFSISPALFKTYFNPIEGFNLNLESSYKRKIDTLGSNFEVSPAIRYGFSSKDVYGKARIAYAKRRTTSQLHTYLEGGRFVNQINSENGISEFSNSFSSLLYKNNYFNAYERTYAIAEVGAMPSAALRISTGFKWENRHPLGNTTNYSLFNKSEVYAANQPANIELPNTAIFNHQAFIANVAMAYRPWLKYRIHNGKKRVVYESSPEFTLCYQKGIRNFMQSDVDFDYVEFGAKHSLNVGAGNRLSLVLEAGSFLNNNATSFIDYKHFPGNQLNVNLFSKASFRLLDYFSYSTNDSFVSTNTQYHFRKFLITRIPEARLLGLKESVFFNYLKTTASPHYFEAGYSIDNIFRLFRFEVAAAFSDGTYQKIGFRTGITSVIRINGR